MQFLQFLRAVQNRSHLIRAAVDQNPPVRGHQGDVRDARLFRHFLHQAQHGILPHMPEGTGAALQSPDQHIGPALHACQHLPLFLFRPSRDHEGRSADARQGESREKPPEKTPVPPLFQMREWRVVILHKIPFV